MFGNLGLGEIVVVLALAAVVCVGLPATALTLALRRVRGPRSRAADAALEAQLRAAEEQVADLTLANARLEDERQFLAELRSGPGARRPGAPPPAG